MYTLYSVNENKYFLEKKNLLIIHTRLRVREVVQYFTNMDLLIQLVSLLVICCFSADCEIISSSEKINETQLPWMSSLMKIDGSRQIHVCSGILINKKYVLTAAHCLYQTTSGGGYKLIKAEEHAVTIGAYDLEEPHSDAKTVEISLITPHPDFQLPALNDDIGLLTLKEEIIFNSSSGFKPIYIPFRSIMDVKHTQDSVTAIGWRVKDNNSTDHNILQQVDLPIPDLWTCLTAIPLEIRMEIYPRRQNLLALTCIGNASEGALSYGDGGSSLIWKTKEDKLVLVGILSAGPSTAYGNGTHNLFTKVAGYYDWIHTIAGNVSFECADPDQVKCDDQTMCTNPQWRCDGYDDCTDKSDEKDCPPIQCRSDQFTCADFKRCIPATRVCDGTEDCADSSDETNCLPQVST